jgi:hypothetical protein
MKTTLRTEAIGLLLEQSGQSDQASAESICDTLQDLSIALAIAGAYLYENKTPLADYLKALIECQDLVLSKGTLQTDYPILVAATYSVNRLWITATGAGMLAMHLGFFAPKNLPSRFLEVFLKKLSGDFQQVTNQPLAGAVDALSILERYKLIELTEDGVSFSHPLVHTAMRGGFPRDAQVFFLEASMILLSSHLPQDPSEKTSWPVYEKFLPHIFALVERSEFFGVGQHMAVRLLAQVGEYCFWSGDNKQAMSLATKVIHLKMSLGEHQQAKEAIEQLYKVSQTDSYEKMKRAIRKMWVLLRMKEKKP